MRITERVLEAHRSVRRVGSWQRGELANKKEKARIEPAAKRQQERMHNFVYEANEGSEASAGGLRLERTDTNEHHHSWARPGCPKREAESPQASLDQVDRGRCQVICLGMQLPRDPGHSRTVSLLRIRPNQANSGRIRLSGVTPPLSKLPGSPLCLPEAAGST